MFLALLFLVQSSPAFIAGENLIICSDSNLFLSSCKLKAKNLSLESSFEREFSIDYFYNCRGHLVEFGFDSDLGFYPVSPSDKNQTACVLGGQLSLVDLKPENTLKATFDQGCRLNIFNLAEELSPRSQSRLTQLESEINAKIFLLQDLKKVDEQVVDLLLSVEEANPEHLNWALKTMKKLLSSNFPDLIGRRAFESRDQAIESLEQELRKMKLCLVESIDKQVKEILSRIDELYFELIEMILRPH